MSLKSIKIDKLILVAFHWLLPLDLIGHKLFFFNQLIGSPEVVHSKGLFQIIFLI